MPHADPLAILLLQLVRVLDPITEQALTSAHGATLSQLAALRVLGSEPFTVTALGEALGIHRSSASRMVNRLVAAGLADKAPSPTSQREVVVTATATGRDAARQVAERRLAALSALLVPLTAVERTAVDSALQSLLRAAATTPNPLLFSTHVADEQ